MPATRPLAIDGHRTRAARPSRSWRRSARTRGSPPAPRPPTAGSAGPDSSGPIAAAHDADLGDQQAQRRRDDQRDGEAEEGPAGPRSRAIDQTCAVVDGRQEVVPDGGRRRQLELVGLNADAQTSCQTDQEQHERHERRQPERQRRRHHGRVLAVGVSSASSPATAQRRPRGRRRLRPRHEVASRDAAGSGHAAWLVMTCAVAGDLRRASAPSAPSPTRHSRTTGRAATTAARPARPSRTASRTSWVTNRIVRAGGLPDPQQLALQHVAGDRVERRERLVHQQHAGTALGSLPRSWPPARGPARRAGACRRTARAGACRPARRAGPATAARPRARRRSRRPRPASCSGSSTLRRGREPRQQRGLLEHERRARGAERRSRPRVGASSPATRLSSVDLPQPDAPSRQTNSPGCDRAGRCRRSAATARRRARTSCRRRAASAPGGPSGARCRRVRWSRSSRGHP